VNQEKTARIRKLGENAQWFEDHMPWDPNYRKPSGRASWPTPSTSWSRRRLGSGDADRHHLPNDQSIREKHGSKVG